MFCMSVARALHVDMLINNRLLAETNNNNMTRVNFFFTCRSKFMTILVFEVKILQF